MRTAETITQEIADLRNQLANLKGTETEVYTRIVGYYRSLRNWNKGKKEEYYQRLPFDVADIQDEKSEHLYLADIQEENEDAVEDITANNTAVLDGISGYRYFYRKTCPSCRPVREFVSRLPLEGTGIDVDTEDGLDQARAFDVQSTPTVVFYDNEGNMKHRYHSINQLREVFTGAV